MSFMIFTKIASCALQQRDHIVGTDFLKMYVVGKCLQKLSDIYDKHFNWLSESTIKRIVVVKEVV